MSTLKSRQRDFTGLRVGHITVVGLVTPDWGRRGWRYWELECDCGNRVIRSTMEVRRSEIDGKRGCCNNQCEFKSWEHRVSHGMTSSRPYQIWGSMVKRCTNPRSKPYADYGGRGITVDPEWLRFEGFWRDMEEGYSDDLTIERVDNEKGYSKANCKWATTKEQCVNRRNSIHITTKEWGRLPLREAVKLAGLSYQTVHTRLKRGVPEENLLDPVAKPPHTSEH